MPKYPKNEPITAVGFNSMVEGMPSATVVSLYCISKYHEKWRITEWCLRALEKRGFTKADMKDFDENFENFYHQMLIQPDL
jgi:hypothetical protein